MLREYIFRGLKSLTIRVVGKKYISRGCDATVVYLLTRSIRAFFTTTPPWFHGSMGLGLMIIHFYHSGWSHVRYVRIEVTCDMCGGKRYVLRGESWSFLLSNYKWCDNICVVGLGMYWGVSQWYFLSPIHPAALFNKVLPQYKPVFLSPSIHFYWLLYLTPRLPRAPPKSRRNRYFDLPHPGSMVGSNDYTFLLSNYKWCKNICMKSRSIKVTCDMCGGKRYVLRGESWSFYCRTINDVTIYVWWEKVCIEGWARRCCLKQHFQY